MFLLAVGCAVFTVWHTAAAGQSRYGHVQSAARFSVEDGLPPHLYLQPLRKFFNTVGASRASRGSNDLVALAKQFRGHESRLWRQLSLEYGGRSPPVPISLRPRAPAFEGVGFPDPSLAYRLLARVVRALDANGIDYVTYGGTVLSHCRHGGHLIPFDDDIDLLVSAADLGRVRVALLESNRDGAATVEAITDKEGGAPRADGNILKAYFADSPKVGGGRYRWRYPYIDIWTYVELPGGNIRARQHIKHNYEYPRSLLFPTRRVDFFFVNSDGVESAAAVLRLPIPLTPAAYLDHEFQASWRTSCHVGFWDHRREVAKPRNSGWRKVMPCAKLKVLHPEWPWSEDGAVCPSVQAKLPAGKAKVIKAATAATFYKGR